MVRNLFACYQLLSVTDDKRIQKLAITILYSKMHVGRIEGKDRNSVY